MLSEPSVLDQFELVQILASQNEHVESLGPRPPRVSVVKRRFPERLRFTPLAKLFGFALPRVDVAFGPFYYAFPSRAGARVVAVHDLSFFHREFHPPAARKSAEQLTRIVHECDGIVCVSDATLKELSARWPHLAHKAVAIYNGASADDVPSPSTRRARARSILVVGTIEPRKNYAAVLDAFERLSLDLGTAAPTLTVVGNLGWMSDAVEPRLAALQASGRCRWLRNCSDEGLAEAYAEAGVFTYLSVYEGFGYPPFEAAFAGCPMVLSNASSVGEIWSGHARTVDPMNFTDIVAAWRWALALDGTERARVVETQRERAREFTWSRCVAEYAAFWSWLIHKDSTVFVGPTARHGGQS
jgi:glycosyltransferase involved in cell wall biosynthesis